ncbi:hypothetical protein BgAZ_501970 [Babesia gibsoni]|uniref:Prefoldin subunit n=1 Tax=Babesia gibsoni TaxID=33632 RepID=A0AAD8LQU9_BABGI|nr:hypothetical protein BgAZ_501970 [Babesia gibsoni]
MIQTRRCRYNDNLPFTYTSPQQFQLLQETQTQIEVLNTQIAKIKQRISTQQLNQKRCEVALDSLQETRPDQRVYKQVSRVLILRDKEQLKVELEKQRDSNREDIPKLNNVKAQLVAKLGGLNSQFVDLSNQLRRPLFRQSS